ncbi:MAG: DUF6688 family protein [Phycisphaerales bacterium]
MQEPTLIPAPEAPLDDDLPCHACGYNLRTRLPSQTCPECGASVSEAITVSEQRKTRPPLTLEGFGVATRVFYVLFGVVLPILPFLIVESNGRPLLVEWQSGHWQDYIGMLLGGTPARPFYPLVILAGVAMVALIAKPVVNGRKNWVRFALLLGVILAGQYTLILGTSFGIGSAIFAGCSIAVALTIAAVFVFVPASWCRGRFWSFFTPRRKAGITIGLILLALLLGLLTGNPFGPLMTPVVVSVLFSPWVCLVVYLLACARICRSSRLVKAGHVDGKDAPWWLLLFGGATGYCLAWAGSISLAIDAYAKLPTDPPDCYICTAAARGHARFVGSEPTALRSGQTIRVNRQMRTCKAVELAIKAITPCGHRALRRAYDRIGPVLAKRMSSPVAADLAYLVIAPVAWVCGGALSLIVPGFRETTDRLYRG